MQSLRKSNLYFIGGALALFVVVQIFLSVGIGGEPIINNYWRGIIFWGAAITIVSLGLNLIFGFNGQFSLGQYGFYAIGAYVSADITYRYVRGDMSALIVVIGGSILTLLLMWGVALLLKRFYGVHVTTLFVSNLLATVLGFWLAVRLLVPALGPVVSTILQALPQTLAQQIVFFFALLGGAAVAGIVSFLFGIPVLELGSDYLGIATLGFAIIVFVLLNNSDTILPFPEMKGARGMVGIPQWTTWPWVFFSLLLVLLVMRNLLYSSVGRSIISVREDERAAELMGIDVGRAKILTFVVGSVFAGLGGGLRGHDMAFLHPSMFNVIQSLNPFIIVVFGGVGSMTGTILTGFGWIILLEGVLRLYLPDGFENWRFVIYPMILVLMMLLRPEGLLGKYEIGFLRQRLPAPRVKSSEAGEEAAA
jgi:branched-chain amino acid transport system permease protein